VSAQPTGEIIDLGAGGISDISKNGQFVCGMNYPAPGFIWSENTGRIELNTTDYSEAYGVSDNGEVAGRFYDPTLPAPNGNPTLRAGYWENGTWYGLVGLNGILPLDEMSFTHAYGISADGSRIAGMQWHSNWTVEAVYWENGNITGLGQTNGGNSRVNALSADGSIMVGWNGGPGNIPDRTAYYWDPAPHFMGGYDTTYAVGESQGVSSDGSMIVGGSAGVVFLWTQATGMQWLTDPSVYQGGAGLDISDDGTIVGYVDPGGFNYQAFIKKPNWSNIVYLSTYINDSLGISGYSDWYFAFGQSISADGTTIGISAYNPSGQPRALLIKMSGIVPVELVSFTASAGNSVINLNWITSTELNNSGFEIQRKNGNTDWTSIGYIIGNGSSSTNNYYNYTDQHPAAGINRYRLKQIDYNGSFEYSEEVAVDFTPAEYYLQQNYPNPFNPTTTINFSIPKEDFVNVTIFNSLGEKTITLVNGVMTSGSHTLTFDAHGLASGMYILKLTSGSYSKTIKMNLLK
jgi:hypothetical protein